MTEEDKESEIIPGFFEKECTECGKKIFSTIPDEQKCLECTMKEIEQ